MRPSSRVVPDSSWMIERSSNRACQDSSRCPLKRIEYLMLLRAPFRVVFPEQRITHHRARMEWPKRYLEAYLGDGEEHEQVNKRLPWSTGWKRPWGSQKQRRI